MTEAESIGTARIDVVINTATMEVGAETAKRKVSGLGTEAAAQFDKANASTKRYAESLLRQAELLGKTRAEQIAYNAQVRVGGELGEQIAKKALAQQEALTRATDAYVMSDKARAAAMRGVPAQITDIVSGLATGQRPLSVLLQQGGQLKDMFGGVGAAAKALGSSLLGLINPATLLAGAAVALFAAWKSGSDEQVAFQKALTTTGNYAGVTVQQLQGLSAELGKTNGSQHEAAAVLAEVAGSGKFTSDQLRLVATAAIAAGDGAGDMVAKFAKLAEDPLKAAVELNSTYHFLTTAVYEQIKALEDQGRTQDAATLAMETYSAAVVERTNAVKANLGLLERSWAAVARTAKGAWDAMLDIGREDTADDQIKKIRDRMEAVRTRSGPMYADLTDTQQTRILASYQASLNQLLSKERDAESDARQKSIAAGAVEALADSDKEAAEFASNQDKRVKALAAARERAQEQMIKAFAAGDIKAAAQIQANQAKIEAGINDRFKDPKPKAEKDLTIDVLTGWKEMVAQIEKGIAADKKEIEQRARATVELNSYREAMRQRLETDKQALDIQVQSLGMGQHQIDIQRQLLDIQRDADRELARLNEPANRAKLTESEYQDRLSAIKDYEDQRVQLVHDADTRLEAARADWTNGAHRAIADITYDAGDAATNFANLVQSTYGSLSDFIVDAATTGKASIKDLVSSILKEVARLEANKAEAALISYGVGLFTGGGYGGTGGQGGVDYNSQGFVSQVYAKGGVVDGASVSNWSSQIVDHPTTFAFARGAGLMGEAGPEAIMPLSRTADGKLGVRTQGGGGDTNVSIAVTVNSDGSSSVDAAGSDQAMGKKFGTAIESAVKKVIANEQRPGGSLWRAKANA